MPDAGLSAFPPENPAMFPAPVIGNLLLIGVGLIGGSLALDLKRQGYVARVTGVDTNEKNLTRALERGVVDEAAGVLTGETVSAADMIVIATPVGTFSTICRQLDPFIAPHTVITDVGSTKQAALEAFFRYLPSHYDRCVAAHPIAGSDRHGATAARFGLFEGKKCVICAHDRQDESALTAVTALWQQCGADIRYLDAGTHDAVFAAVSHLPHALSFAYMHGISTAADADTLLAFAGSGFRDFTRIAGSHPEVWTDICSDNRDLLYPLISEQIDQLKALQRLLAENDKTGLKSYFSTARSGRKKWEAGQ